MKSYYEEKARNLYKPMMIGQTLEPIQLGSPITTVIAKKPNEDEFVAAGPCLDMTQMPMPKLEVPEELQGSTNMETYMKTLTTFTGADMVVSVGDKIHGDISGIVWYSPTKLELSMLDNSDYYDKRLAKKRPVVVKITRTIFNNNNPLPDDTDITINFANEYGMTGHITIFNASPLNYSLGSNVDSIMLEEEILLCATDISKLEPGIVKEVIGKC